MFEYVIELVTPSFEDINTEDVSTEKISYGSFTTVILATYNVNPGLD